MKPALAAEGLKLRTTTTVWSLLGTMTALVTAAVALHGASLPAADLAGPANQGRILAFGVSLGTVFAALLSALTITAEHRHGTIRPTLLGVPNRARVLLAKAAVGSAAALGFGLAAAAIADAVLLVTLNARGIPVQLDSGSTPRLLLGAAAAAAVYAALGVGVGALVRNQVPTLIGIFAWLFIVENLLIDALPDLSRYLPASLAQELAASIAQARQPISTSLALLAAYAAVLLLLGGLRMTRTDVA
jgi:hypothetical protein